MNKLVILLSAALMAGSVCAKPVSVAGIYPQLAMFNQQGECGTGAVVPWADRLWAITYAPHRPSGSDDKLYEITPDLQQIIRPESIGGTPANRMIHRESGQLFIGPYAIDASRNVRAIPYNKMFGRHTGLARHLTEPAGKIVFATMEEGVYELDVKTLEVRDLWIDEQLVKNGPQKKGTTETKAGRAADLPGYHGKGFYSSQGRYVYANNGDHAGEALTNPAVPSGVLAEWDGKADKWTVVRRNQFTDVSGPGGVEGGDPDDPLWSIGWDHRSLILMLLDQGKWHSFRLPKASHCYDGAHGWNTEWPRIREIGEDSLLMTMHGSFWKFPKSFSAANTAGIVPRSTYLKVVGDFCRWKDQLVLGCDDAAKSEFLNKDALKGDLAGPGISQSNLWFISPGKLDQCGPPLGRGAVWLAEDVPAALPSEPFLFAGFDHRMLHLAHHGAADATFILEVDAAGDGSWKKLRDVSVPPKSSVRIIFGSEEKGTWIRVSSPLALTKASAVFHYRNLDQRGTTSARIFDGLAQSDTKNASTGTLLATGDPARALRFLASDSSGELGCYDLDAELKLTKSVAAAEGMKKSAALPKPGIVEDAASFLYVDEKGARWRLPKGSATHSNGRICREVCTERNLLHVGGTFYELPARNAGGMIKVRPIATHDFAIHDFASYRGLLALSGIDPSAQSERIVQSDDGKCALWLGVVDDLWSLGKPRGTVGPWKESSVKAGVPSDPCLATGYDRKSLTISSTSTVPVSVRLEADFSGTGTWSRVESFTTEPGKPLTHRFPESFGAYWLRLMPESDAVITAQFLYE